MGHFMHTTILTFLAALSVNARPSQLQSYELPQSQPSSPPGSSTNPGIGRPCTGEEVHNALGECVLPEISRNIFVYAAPNIITKPGPVPNIPKPQVQYNLVFVKTADLAQQNQPIIVPPPQQKTLVYVLSKKQQQGGNNVIYAPHNPAVSPEVFYVNYGPGDNPQLPGGVDLQTALSSAFSQDQNFNGQNQGNNFVGTGQNQGNNFVGTGQNQGNNFVGSGQNQGNNFVGTGQNQGNNYVGNVIDGPTISGGLVSPAINSPPINGGNIDGGFISGGIIDSGFGVGVPLGQSQQQSPAAIQGGIIDSGFGGGVPLGQSQIDSGFGNGFGQSSFVGNNVNVQSPTSFQGGLIDPGFGGGVPLGQSQIDSGFGTFGQDGFGQDGFGQQPGGVSSNVQQGGFTLQDPIFIQSTTGVQTPSTSQGYQYPTPSIPLTSIQGGQSSLSSPSGPPPPPPSRPGQIYLTPN